jgi:hypothetical protein
MIPMNVDELFNAEPLFSDAGSLFSGVPEVPGAPLAAIPRNDAGMQPVNPGTPAQPPRCSRCSAPLAEMQTSGTPGTPAHALWCSERGDQKGIDTTSVRDTGPPGTPGTPHKRDGSPGKKRSAQALGTPADAWRCYCCHGMQRWRSVHGRLICTRCHPPADEALAVGWVGEEQ